MADNISLPQGFVLDNQAQPSLPAGFVLDGAQQQRPATPTAETPKATKLDRYLMWVERTNKAQAAYDDERNRGGTPDPELINFSKIPWPTQDEADATIAAQGGQSTPMGMLRSAGRAMFGIGPNVGAAVRSTFNGEKFADALNDERALQEKFAAAQPNNSLGAGVMGMVGSAAVPVGRVLQGAKGIPSLAMRSVGLGGGLAAGTGFAEGTGGPLERLESAGQHAYNFATNPTAVALSMLPVGARFGSNFIGAVSRPGSAANAAVADARANAAVNASRIQDKLDTAASFENQGVRNVAPFNMDKTGGTTARVVANLPVVGDPMMTAMVDSYGQARQAGERLARGLTTADTMEEAGQALTGGLARYRGSHLQDLNPDELTALGIPPTQPVNPNATATQGALQRAQRARPIAQAEGLNEGPLQQPTTRPTRIEDVGNPTDPNDPSLMRLVRGTNPANPSEPSVPFATQADAMYERARRGIPDLFKKDGSSNPSLVGTPNSAHVVRGMLQQESSARINGGILNGRFGQMAQDLASPNSNWTVNSLMAARTEVGRALSSFGEFETGLNVGQLKTLYGALTSDIEAGMRDVAHRAVLATRGQGYYGPNGQPLTAKQAQNAIDSIANFRTANNYFSTEMERMDRFQRLLGTDTPEKAMAAFQRAALSGAKGDLGMLRAARGSLTNDQWNTVSGVVLRNMWAPVPSARGYVAETGFSPASFTTRWNAMEPEARRLLFGHVNQRNMQDFVNVTNAMAKFESTVNSSGSGEHLITALVGGEFLLNLLHNPVASLGLPALGRAATSAFASPQFTRALTGMLRARLQLARTIANGTMAPNYAPLRNSIQALSVVTRVRPDLAPVVSALVSEANKTLSLAPGGKDNRKQIAH